MNNSKDSYKQIFKATTIFAGVQFFNIIVSVIKSKIIAVLLGPKGVGIITLLNSSSSILGSITGFGLESSGVKSISQDFASGNQDKLNKKIAVFKHLILITSVLGAFLTLVFSSYLSQLTFGNKDFSIAFVWLSIAVLFKQLLSGHLTILQSLGKLRHFAKANLFGNFVSLVITVPMYFYWKIDAIAPAIVMSSIISFSFSFLFSRKHYLIKEKMTFKSAITDGKPMLILGVALSLSELFRVLSEYIIQIGISYYGDVNQVGLYGAGLLILNTYLGIIFVVMSKNYYPKLSEICNDNEKIRDLIFHQSYLSLLMITPIIILFIITAPFLVEILFTSKFNSILTMVSWGVLGMLFKALSWTLGYVIIAKGDSKVFIKTSVFFSMLYLLMLLGGYYISGLLGLGISFFVYYIIHFFAIKTILYKRYGLYLNKEVYMLFFKCCLFCGVTFLLTYLPWAFYKYLLMSLIAIFSGFYILFLLNEKVPLKELLSLISKKRHSD